MRYPSIFKYTSDPTNMWVLIIGVVMAVLTAVLIMLSPKPFRQLDRMSYDFMLRGLGEKASNPFVLVVDVDEASLARYGQWPWPRHLVARMLDVVRDGEPDAVGIDILFAEPDRTSLGRVSAELKSGFGVELDIKALPLEMVDNDWALSCTLLRDSFYLGVMFRFGEGAVEEVELPDSRLQLIEVKRKGDGSRAFPVADGVVATLPALTEAADGVGFVNVVPDADGVIRRAPLFIRYGDTLFPSLALAAFMRSRQSASVILESGPEGMISIETGGTHIPVDRQGNIAVRFRGPSGAYNSISAADILDGKIAADTFHHKIVFVGSSAEGLKDTHPTPFDRRFSGVEVHASVAGAMLDQDFIAIPAWTTGAQGIGAFLVVLLALTVVLRFSTWAAGVMLFGFLFIIPMGAMTLFELYHIFISPASAMVVYVTAFALLALVRFRSEELRAMHRERELAAARDCAIVGWASLAETRDTETGRHILRTQKYILALAQYLLEHKNQQYQLHPKEVEVLFKSSPLHDIGKVGVPDSILLKPGPLEPAEFEEMKKHTTYGAEALTKAEVASGITDEASFLKTARDIALTHHEKWDGSGYPNRLKGEEIPLSGRLMAVADVYDALISSRVYKKPMSHAQATTIIHNGHGTHFDPEIVTAFAALEDKFQAIAETYKDEK